MQRVSHTTLIIILSDRHRAAKSRPNSPSRQFWSIPNFFRRLIYTTCLPTTALTTPPTKAYSAWVFLLNDRTSLQESYSLRKTEIDGFRSPCLDARNLAELALAQLHGLHH